MPILQDICTSNRNVNLRTLEQVIVPAIEVAIASFYLLKQQQNHTNYGNNNEMKRKVST